MVPVRDVANVLAPIAGGMTKGAGERTKDPAPLIGGTPRGASLPPPEFLPPLSNLEGGHA